MKQLLIPEVYHDCLSDQYSKGTHLVLCAPSENFVSKDENGNVTHSEWDYKGDTIVGNKPEVLLISDESESLDNFLNRFLDQDTDLHEDTFVYTVGSMEQCANNLWHHKGKDDPERVRGIIKYIKEVEGWDEARTNVAIDALK